MKKKLLIAGAIVVLVVGVGLGILVSRSGALIKLGVETGGTQATKTKTSLAGAGLGIFAGKIALDDLDIANPEGFQSSHAFKVGHVHVDADVGSLLGDTVRMEEIVVESPQVTLEISREGSNLGKLLGNLQGSKEQAATPAPEGQEPPAEGEGQSSTQLVVSLIKITGAKVTVAQSVLGHSELSLELAPLELKDVGTQQDPSTFPDLIQQVVGAIMAGILTHKDLPPELAALLQGELALPSFDALRARLEGVVGEKLAGLKDEATEQVDALKDKATEQVDALKDKAAQVGEDLGSKADEVKDQAQDAADDAQDQAQDAAADAKDQAEDKTEEVKDQAQDAADDLKDKAKDGADKLKDAFGGFGGG